MQSEEEYNKQKQIFDNLSEERYNSGLDTFKLTRQQKRKIFKQDKFSNKIKQLLKPSIKLDIAIEVANKSTVNFNDYNNNQIKQLLK
jgi:hypothetical protein